MSGSRLTALVVAGLLLVVSAVTTLSRREQQITLPSVPSEEPSTPVPTKTDAASRIVRSVTTPDCPEMDNPGGLRWEPTSNAGPFATNGSVILPTLGVEAPIVRVLVGPDGKMVVPGNARDVAWLDQGPIPGDTRNVVLAGHISYSRVIGSFHRLSELAEGDRITVEMDGRHHKYRVVWNCYFDRDTSLASQIMGKTNVESVTLISCGGVFDPRAGTHTKRIAVRAERVKDA